jgi:hypothetical protein
VTVAGERFDGKRPKSLSVTPPAVLTLNVTDDIAGEEAKKPKDEICGIIHYRPQLKTTARTITTSEGIPRAATANAGPFSGEVTDIR